MSPLELMSQWFFSGIDGLGLASGIALIARYLST